MFTDQQLDQLRQLFASYEKTITNAIEAKMTKVIDTRLSKTQKGLEAKISKLDTKLSETREEMIREHKDQAQLFQEITVHIDSSQKEIIDTLTERMSVALTHHDKRITRVEKHLDLPPLE